MTPCKHIHRWLPDALSGELDPVRQKEFDDHLAECTGCRKEFETLNAVPGKIEAYRRPDPDAVDWNRYWDKLEARLPERKPSLISRVRFNLWESWGMAQTPRLALGAAFILVVGIFIGRAFFSQSSPVAHQASNDPVLIEAGQYIERSKLILLGIVNTDPGSDAAGFGNLSKQQTLSRKLVDQAGPLKAALDASRQPMLSELVEELQRVLIQIANLETIDDLKGVELIRSGAEHNAILFKINIGELYLSRPESIKEKTDRTTT